jgi:hypothetical protein
MKIKIAMRGNEWRWIVDGKGTDVRDGADFNELLDVFTCQRIVSELSLRAGKRLSRLMYQT